MHYQNLEKIREVNNIQFFQEKKCESIRAVYKDVLIGATDISKKMAVFEVDTKEGLNPYYYGLNNKGLLEPSNHTIKKLEEVRGREVLENLVDIQLNKGAIFLVSCWKYGDNLKKFNQNLNDGLSIENAIRNTFTAKVYEKFGFDNFTIFNLKKNCTGYEMVESIFYSDPLSLEMINKNSKFVSYLK